MIRCPACGETVQEAQVEAGLAQCTACQEVFEVAAAPAPSAPAKTTRALPEAPPGVQLETIDEGYQVTLSWRSDFGPLRLAYRVLPVTLYLLGMVYLGLTQPESMVPLLVSAPFLVYMVAYPLVNRTTVLIADRGVVVTHGPIPVPGFLQEVLVPRDQVLQLYVEEETQRSRGASWHTYALSARGPRGDSKLTGRWHDIDALRFVEALAEQTMGIENVELIGEHRGPARTSALL